jgi:hypothetical protein
MRFTSPSNKWLAAQVSAIAAFLSALIVAGEMNTELWLIVVGIVSQAIVTYLVPHTPVFARTRQA